MIATKSGIRLGSVLTGQAGLWSSSKRRGRVDEKDRRTRDGKGRKRMYFDEEGEALQ
jgi:hypothetical protein